MNNEFCMVFRSMCGRIVCWWCASQTCSNIVTRVCVYMLSQDASAGNRMQRKQIILNSDQINVENLSIFLFLISFLPALTCSTLNTTYLFLALRVESYPRCHIFRHPLQSRLITGAKDSVHTNVATSKAKDVSRTSSFIRPQSLLRPFISLSLSSFILT